jgi:hypothetical protein
VRSSEEYRIAKEQIADREWRIDTRRISNRSRSRSPKPPERWQTRARKQQQERRLLAKPLLKGVA